ncbi:hypothetical protein [Thermus sp. LT1-2-5]|uniref:hypothetical protein n=1 Tax=Thermus sp. LT1-2-5 TaxID=3026935 RepID=UPI003365A74A
MRVVSRGEELYAVTEGRGVLVAIGNRLYVSEDGQAWVEKSLSPQPAWLGGIAFAEDKGLFAAVGAGGTIYTSEDGQTWSNRASGTTRNLLGVAYGAGTFVAVGQSGTVLRSTNGIQWTAEQLSGADDIYSIAFGEGKFVINGRGGMFVSPDQGLTWQRLNAVTSVYSPVVFGVGRFVAASAYPGKVIVYDGTNLNEVSLPTSDTVSSVAFVKDHFLALTRFGQLLASPNGVDWDSIFTPGDSPRAVYRLGDRFFLLLQGHGTSTRVAFSPDGVQWTLSGSTIPATVNALARGGNRYVAVGDNGALFCSNDGETWLPAQAPGATPDWDLTAAVYTGSRFVAVGLGGLVLASEDGCSWQVKREYSPIDGNFYALAYGEGKLVGASEGGRFWISTDQGETWEAVYAAVEANLNDIVFANGRFVAVGERTTILVSDDGETWLEEETNLPGLLTYADLYAVAHDPERDIFLVTGHFSGEVNGEEVLIPVILRKQGGGDWARLPVPSSAPYLVDFSSLAFGNGRFVAAGEFSLGLTP